MSQVKMTTKQHTQVKVKIDQDANYFVIVQSKFVAGDV